MQIPADFSDFIFYLRESAFSAPSVFYVFAWDSFLADKSFRALLASRMNSALKAFRRPSPYGDVFKLEFLNFVVKKLSAKADKRPAALSPRFQSGSVADAASFVS